MFSRGQFSSSVLGAILTVDSGATLQLVGSSDQSASVISTGTSAGYSVQIDGTIKAQYYSFNNLTGNGVSINSGATIDSTYYLQNGSFSYPVSNGTTLLTLNRQIPGNVLSNMVFDSGGSGASGVYGITTNASSGTLVISDYSGDRTGDSYTNDPTYLVSWGAPTNTIIITQEVTGPSSVNQGETYNMGSFGFQQTQAGSFANTNITQIKLTLTGTGDASDISAARIFYDASCSGSGGTQLGSSTFIGSPPVATFSSLSGAVVESDVSSPPKRCIYVEYDIGALATNGETVGAKIELSSHVSNSEEYEFNGSYAPPIDLGTAATIVGSTTVWTGASSTNWYTAGNWNGGVPTASLNCSINSAARNPVISGGTATCKSLVNGNGSITMNSGAILEIYGSFSNTGSFSASGSTLQIRDNGSTSMSQTVESAEALEAISFNKTAGGEVLIGGSSLTINSLLQLGAGNDFTLKVGEGKTLIALGGANVDGATMQLDKGSTLKMASGQSFQVSGGTFKTTGVNDAYPQETSNKALITRNNSSGTWSFSATSGTLELTGFLIDWLDDNGLNIGGTTTVTNIDGGQLRNLSENYSSLKALQLNTSQSLPSVVSNFGWNWGPDNTPPDDSKVEYTLVYSSGCAGQTVDFDQWFGDFYDPSKATDMTSKIDCVDCYVSVSATATPVTITFLQATGFNGEVVLEWETGLEWDHLGFNVYRSQRPDGGFVQINTKLIQRNVYSTSVHGRYAFYDRSVINGTQYYYLLEDVAINGDSSLWGPVNAYPDHDLASAPLPESDVVVATGDGEAVPIPVTDDLAYTVIASGIYLIGQTQHFLRLKIEIPEVDLSASEVAPYQQLTIPGYSRQTHAGYSELLERTIMLKIPAASRANFELISNQQQQFENILVAPAPLWKYQHGELVAQWKLDKKFYRTDEWNPLSPVSLGKITSESGHYYLPIKIYPVSFNPVRREIITQQEMVIDIALDDYQDWGTGTEIDQENLWGVEGGLQIGVTRAGIYRISYEDLEQQGLIGPFDGQRVNDFQLFFKETELPLEVESAGEYFGPMDQLIFFAPHLTNTDETYLLLLVGQDGKKMASYNSEPVSHYANYHRVEKRFEEDYFAFLSEPYGEEMDHILWDRIFSPPLKPGDNLFSQVIELPGLIQEGDVEFRFLLKGGHGAAVYNGKHHVRLLVNSNIVDQHVVFDSLDPIYAVFQVPAIYLVPGKNRIQLEVLGDYIENDYDVINIDHFTVNYFQDLLMFEGQMQINTNACQLVGLQEPELYLYDVSTLEQISKVEEYSLLPDGNSWQLQFAASAGRKFWIAEKHEIYVPSSLQLNAGNTLKDSSNQADIIYVGTRELLDAITPLAYFREQEGFSVKLVDIEEIYHSFGGGQVGPQCIKEFIEYVQSNWGQPVSQYLILVGDGTYDPQGKISNVPRNSLPIKLLRGQYWDYASDNWFTDSALAVGRIPGNTHQEVTNYVNKVLAYESGEIYPTEESGDRVVLAADKLSDFGQQSLKLKELIGQSNSGVLVETLQRDELGDTDFRQQILDSFENGAAIVHYLGHGAENMWAGNNIFTTEDAAHLQNRVTPLVVAMDCLNAFFYGEDQREKSLGEVLIFNPNGGAIAFWGSTSLTSPSVQVQFQNLFYELLVKNPGMRIGDAIKLVKQGKGDSSSYQEVVNSWTLLGDPLIKIALKNPPTSGQEPGPGTGCDAHAADARGSKGQSGIIFELIWLLLTIVVVRFFRRTYSI